MRFWLGLAAAGLVAVGAALVAIVCLRPVGGPAKLAVQKPTLYCEFYNFMHNATVVSFNFTVERDAEKKLAFRELFVVEPDGTRTDFSSEPPPWRSSSDDGVQVLTSPDAETRIVLYGLKPATGGVFWTEAGVRSNTYRNLEGKCRQAHLDKVAAAAGRS